MKSSSAAPPTICVPLEKRLCRCCGKISRSLNDVLDARLMGADCLLLIAAALDGTNSSISMVLPVEIGLDVLVEIHDETELEIALDGSDH